MKRNSLDAFNRTSRTRVARRTSRDARERAIDAIRSARSGETPALDEGGCFPNHEPSNRPLESLGVHPWHRKNRVVITRVATRNVETYRSGSKPRTAPNCARDAFFAADARGATTTRDAATVVALVSIISYERRGSVCVDAARASLGFHFYSHVSDRCVIVFDRSRTFSWGLGGLFHSLGCFKAMYLFFGDFFCFVLTLVVRWAVEAQTPV
jgi:hypothetical protein